MKSNPEISGLSCLKTISGQAGTGLTADLSFERTPILACVHIYYTIIWNEKKACQLPEYTRTGRTFFRSIIISFLLTKPWLKFTLHALSSLRLALETLLSHVQILDCVLANTGSIN